MVFRDIDWTGYLNEIFGIATNPMYWSLEPVGSLIFLRGDVSQGDIIYKRRLSFEDVDYMRARWEDMGFPAYILGVGSWY